MGKKLRVAIIGAGMIANAGHIPAWKNQKAAAEIVGVYNHHLERAQATAARHGIPHAYDDLARMLDELRPDVVSVTTPNMAHKPHTIQALQAGAHVVCEKPVATTYADAVAMFDAAQAAGRKLFVAQTGRFTADSIAAKEIADSGQLGEVYYAETSSLRRRGVPKWGRFHMREHSGGGPLLDIGVHALDLLLWLMGNPPVIAASGQTYLKLAHREEGLITSLADSGAPVGVHDPRPYDPTEYDVEDLAAGFLRCQNGATVSIKASWAANVPEGMGGTFLLGTEGGLRLRPLLLVRNMGSYQVDITPIVPRDPDVPFYGHWRLMEHVVRAIREEEEPSVKREEALNVIRALEGLYRSAAEGREVVLE
ncbi:MAG: Gfo/Idh/MocA family oxidoreductase [Chloroflexi bacterium]|nr:Gfo/Idh/MocA family oxidoreductase [Chloroflexota bacterium]